MDPEESVMNRQGFTLIETMVAMVAGLTAIIAVYSLGATMSEHFFKEHRISSSQSASRSAILQLRSDIARAGLFGTPNANLERTCDATVPQLPDDINGGTLPMGTFQYHFNEDRGVLDPNNQNPQARFDRLRVLTSLYSTDALTVASANPGGTVVVFRNDDQAFRRMFAWGLAADSAAYLTGTLGAGAPNTWQGVAATGARSFQNGSVLHIETPEGRHFFRMLAAAGTTGGVPIASVDATLTMPLPVGTACLPGAAEGSMAAPLQWVEYQVVDPFDTNGDGTPDFMVLNGVFQGTTNPSAEAAALTADQLIESPNLVLIRRVLNAQNGNPLPGTTQILAEFVAHFAVDFVIDTTSGQIPSPQPTAFARLQGLPAEVQVNPNPQQVRTVIVTLGIRAPMEEPNVVFAAGPAGQPPMTFEVDPAQRGAARVRTVSIEIPVTNVGWRNL